MAFASDRDNKIVILTGVGDYMADIDFGSFGNVGDANAWSKVHDEGTQLLENIANIRVPMIAAIEGNAHIHTEYALLANVIVAGKGATFHDLPTSRASFRSRCGRSSTISPMNSRWTRFSRNTRCDDADHSPGNRACCGRLSAMSCQGAFEPTKMCIDGSMPGASTSVPIVTWA